MSIYDRWRERRSARKPVTKKDLKEIERKIMAKLSELAGIVTTIADTVDKIKIEVQALKDGLGDAELPAEAQAALDRLSTLVKEVDDINPDAPVA